MTKNNLLLVKKKSGVLKAAGGLGTSSGFQLQNIPDIWDTFRKDSVIMGAKPPLIGGTTPTKLLNSPMQLPQTPSFGAGLGANVAAAAPTVTGGIDATKTAVEGAKGVAKEAGGNAGMLAGGISAGVAIANMAGQAIIDKRKNEPVNEFGLVDPDEKAMKSKGLLSGMSAGASLGASVGSFFPGIGTGIGTFVGGVGGAVTGFLKGKKQGEEAQLAYNKQTTNAINARTRSQDMADSAALYGAKGTKFNIPKHTSTRLIVKYRSGGKLEEAGAVNIVPKGKLHKENNNLGNKDKGIPVIGADGVKEYEVEKEELILRLEATQKVEALVYEFNRTKNEEVLDQLGSYLTEELLSNTHDYTGKFKVKIVE